jgi:two-component system, OmpR family, response regulator RegX3
MRVMVVGDRVDERSRLGRGLARFGVEVVGAEHSPERVDRGQIDLVLYDLARSRHDPLEGCRRLRAKSRVPIMVVSPSDREEERIEWFEVGADQFAVEPVGANELVARIRAATRRVKVAPNDAELRVGRLTIDTRAHRACVDDIEIALAVREYDLLVHLARAPGVAHSQRELFDAVWGEPWIVPSKTIAVHISQLRRKLGSHDWIESCRGGYRLTIGE